MTKTDDRELAYWRDWELVKTLLPCPCCGATSLSVEPVEIRCDKDGGCGHVAAALSWGDAVREWNDGNSMGDWVVEAVDVTGRV